MSPELRARGYIATKGLLESSLARVVYKTLLLNHGAAVVPDNHNPPAERRNARDALPLTRPRIVRSPVVASDRPIGYARVYFHGDHTTRSFRAAVVGASPTDGTGRWDSAACARRSVQRVRRDRSPPAGLSSIRAWRVPTANADDHEEMKASSIQQMPSPCCSTTGTTAPAVAQQTR
jgi:hypothetical protein